MPLRNRRRLRRSQVKLAVGPQDNRAQDPGEHGVGSVFADPFEKPDRSFATVLVDVQYLDVLSLVLDRLFQAFDVLAEVPLGGYDQSQGVNLARNGVDLLTRVIGRVFGLAD